MICWLAVKWQIRTANHEATGNAKVAKEASFMVGSGEVGSIILMDDGCPFIPFYQEKSTKSMR